jgi:hypothetical protein
MNAPPEAAVCRLEGEQIMSSDALPFALPGNGPLEVQRFRQKLLWGLIFLMILCSTLVLLLPMTSACPRSLELYTFGNVGIAVLCGILIPLLLGSARLETSLEADGVRVRFFPLSNRLIKYADIERCFARDYRPIMEYGGWGIRWSVQNGRAYNVSGTKGVQLILKDGKKVLIGSQRAEEVAARINERMGRR